MAAQQFYGSGGRENDAYPAARTIPYNPDAARSAMNYGMPSQIGDSVRSSEDPPSYQQITGANPQSQFSNGKF